MVLVGDRDVIGRYVCSYSYIGSMYVYHCFVITFDSYVASAGSIDSRNLVRACSNCCGVVVNDLLFRRRVKRLRPGREKILFSLRYLKS